MDHGPQCPWVLSEEKVKTALHRSVRNINRKSSNNNIRHHHAQRYSAGQGSFPNLEYLLPVLSELQKDKNHQSG